ncbi:MAG: hypothetical protein RQ752_11660 [Thermohalobaculum sp.]|nr:hypothetical protein [Thermohalobaculum sp.]
MRRLRAGLVLAALGAGLAGGPARAATGAECVVAMAGADTAARVDFETGLAALVAQVAPEQAGLAAMSRDVQVLLAEDRLDRLTYLAEVKPHLFRGEAGAIDWTAQDEASYIAAPGHAERMERISALGQTLEADPGRAALQELFATVITRLFEFQKLMVDHNAARKAAADAFTACRDG